jgi:hypothetical protein
MTRGEWWLLAHARGLHTFPLTAGMKTPTTGPWEKYKTERPSADQIRAWSGQGLNYGIICGTPNPENPDEQLAVIDVDKVDGWQSWLDDRGQEEPNTGWVTTTPRGGKHLPYWIPAEMAVSISKGCGPDGAWDIRGRGGYVVGPGCHTVDIGHPEKQVAGVYSVSGNDLIPGTAPDWLAAWFPIWAPAREGLGLDNEPPRHTTKSPSENTGNNQTWTIDGLENGREDYGTKTVWAVFRELIDRGGWTKETLAREMLEVAWTQYSAKATSRHPEGLEAEGRGKRMILEKVQDCIRRNWDDRAGEGGVPDPRKDEHPATEVSAQAPSGLVAASFQWVDPSRIPPRQWLYGNHYIRRFLSSTTASGGVGKSSLVLVEAMSMVTGSDLLEATKDEMGWHKPTLPQRSKVWMVNLEDPLEEMQRRVMAAAIHYELNPDDLAGLFLNSGRDTELVIARKMQNEVVVQEPVIKAIEASVRECGIDVLIIDPFIHSHAVPENDNSELAVVVDAWRRLADKLNISIELIHHMRKLNGQEATHEDSRGAKALVDACRSVRALSKLTKDQGARLAIREEDQPGLFYMGRGDKQNMAPSFSHDVWRKMVGVPLGNATVEYPGGDEVGVAVGWTPPKPDEGVTREHLFEIQRQLCNGDERKARAWQSKDWVGRLVAEVLQLDADEDRKQIEKLLQIWIENGALVTEVAWSAGGNKRREVIAGELAVNG